MNQDFIEDFLRLKRESTTEVTVHNYRRFLVWLDKELGKDFKRVKTRDVKGVLGQEMAKSTQEVYKIYCRQFFAFLGRKDIVKALPVYGKNLRGKPLEASQILTREDVKRLIQAMNGVRNQAVAAVLYESAMRATEFLQSKVKNIAFDEYGAFFSCNGKTGSRRLRLIESVPYLQRWLEAHPFKAIPDAYLWGGVSPDKTISLVALHRLLKRAAKRIKLKKRVNPHSLRHARLTETANGVLSDQQLKVFAGWSADSRMAQRYVHLSCNYLDEPLLRAAGLRLEDREQTLDTPKICWKCHEQNGFADEYCRRCGSPLDKKKVVLVPEPDEIASLKNQIGQLQETNRKYERITASADSIEMLLKRVEELEKKLAKKT